MVLMEFSMAPVGGTRQGDSVSEHVARVIDVIDRSGLPCPLMPMGPIVEGEWNQCMALMTRCVELPKAEFPRVGVQMKVDDRDAPAGRLKSKTARVEERLGRKFAT
jgi:uncharacterized protein (TIGR00106 family)